MQFTCNTKPLAEALNLAVVNANISSLEAKTNLISLYANNGELRMNLLSDREVLVKTEIIVKGSGTEPTSPIAFVNNTQFKSLINSIDASSITIEFMENGSGIIIMAGKSRFKLETPVVSDGDMEFDRPIQDEGVEVPFNLEDWKFIKTKQLYAVADDVLREPIYKYVWVGTSGDVVTGNTSNEFFTWSTKSHLGTSALISPVIINLLVSLPESTKMFSIGKDYIVRFNCDSFSYAAQFSPKYETDEGVGPYYAETVIIPQLQHVDGSIQVDSVAITKLLAQAELLANPLEDSINYSVESNTLVLSTSSVHNEFVGVGQASEPYNMLINTSRLKKAVSSFSGDLINISPVLLDGEVQGVRMWNDQLTVMLGKSTH